MRTTTVPIAVLSAVVLQLPVPTAVTGQESDPSVSNAEARALVDAALEAMGGEALANLRTLSYDISGNRYWLGQGRGPETEARMPLRGHLRLDYQAGRLRQGTATYQESEPYFCFDTVIGSL